MLVGLGWICCPALAGFASPGHPAGSVLRSGSDSPSLLEVAETVPIELPGVGTALGQRTDEPATIPDSSPEVAEVEVPHSAMSPALAERPTPPLTPGTYLTTAAALIPPSAEPWFPAGSLAQGEAGNGDRGEDEDEDEAEEEPSPPDPELGVVQVRELQEDSDLGILRIRDQPASLPQVDQPAPKIGFLLARLGISSSDNILLGFNDVGGLTGDTFVRPSLSLVMYPSLGPQTTFIAVADVGLQRYVSQSSLNYDDLRFRVGVRQGLTPRSYGQVILGYQELFRPGFNRARFFKNTSLGLTLGRRDPLARNLTLDSYYLVQFNGAQSFSGSTTIDFSRFFQSAGAYLSYNINPQLQVGISYQLNLIDYTAQDRYDTFQQVLGQVSYRITPAVRLSLYGGFNFGQSSEPQIQFNDTLLGAAIEARVPLF
jgi:hypothetical protein